MPRIRRRAVWIDDKPRSIARHAEKLNSMGWNVEIFRPEDDYVRSAKTADAVLLDLHWSPPRSKVALNKWPMPSSRTLAQVLTIDTPQKPLLFVSNFFADSDYGNIEKEISPAALTGRVEKRTEAPSASSLERPLAKDIVHEIDQKLSQLIERSENALHGIPDSPGVTSNVSKIFQVSPKLFHQMDSDSKLDLTKRAGLVVQELVDWEFENSDADWIVVGGVPPRVLYWGAEKEILTDKDMDNLATAYDAIPYYFSQPEYLF